MAVPLDKGTTAHVEAVYHWQYRVSLAYAGREGLPLKIILTKAQRTQRINHAYQCFANLNLSELGGLARDIQYTASSTWKRETSCSLGY